MCPTPALGASGTGGHKDPIFAHSRLPTLDMTDLVGGQGALLAAAVAADTEKGGGARKGGERRLGGSLKTGRGRQRPLDALGCRALHIIATPDSINVVQRGVTTYAHTVQAKGRSPVWDSSWPRRAVEVTKARSQFRHLHTRVHKRQPHMSNHLQSPLH